MEILGRMGVLAPVFVFRSRETAMAEPKRAVLGRLDEEQPCLWVINASPFLPIWQGRYKLVFGTPRKLWPIDSGKGVFLHEYYEYELKERGMESTIEKFKSENLSALEAYEIEGDFDPEGECWKGGAEIKVKDYRSGKIMTISVSDWTFSLYEGDKLYAPDGTLVLGL